jgi:hypothetical protein
VANYAAGLSTFRDRKSVALSSNAVKVARVAEHKRNFYLQQLHQF